MPTLNLPESPAAAVWDLIKARLRADPDLSTSGVELVFFDQDSDRNPIADLQERGGPAVVFLATLGRMGWFTEGSLSAALVVSYQANIPSLDDRDLMNLQNAIVSALYPDDDFAFRQSLEDAGAVTGLIVFPQSLSLPIHAAGASGQLQPTGQFVLDVETTI